MISIKIIIYLLFMFILSFNVFGSPIYFKFKPDSYLLISDRVVTIDFFHDIVGRSEEDFKVRPIVSLGSAYILNTSTNSWMPSSAEWLSLPSLGKLIKLKVNNVLDNKVDLHFQIQDTNTSKIYETPAVSFWTYTPYVDYLKDLNSHLSMSIESEQ